MVTKGEQPQTPDPEKVRLFQANLDDEINGIAIYRMLVLAEPDPERRSIFEKLAEVEERHANVWRQKLREAGVQPKERGPSLKVRLVGFLARRFGVRSVLPIARSLEAGAYSVYMAQDKAAQAIAPDERAHDRTLARMQRLEAAPTTNIAAGETWHRTGGGGTLRATVFGVSDGLVSNTSLIMGFSGAQVEGKFVLLAGVAGLLAGAFSMASGEYVSMQAQRELFKRQIELEKGELEAAPEEEEQELALIYQAKGFPKEQAEAMAAKIMEDPQVALDTLVREELGLNPSQLGSPWGATIGSFLAFGVGAVVPVIPFLFSASTDAPVIIASAVLSAIALFAVGVSLSLFTGRSALASGGRQLALGAVAAVLTFGIGRLVGITTDV